MNHTHEVLLIVVIALVTILLRFLPFLIFGRKQDVPEIVTYLGKYLPYAMIAMLVIYCLRGVSVTKFPFGMPEWIASALVILVHNWKRNTLLSILSGTIVYMLLVQFVF